VNQNEYSTLEKVELILKHKSDINAKNIHGCTALHIFCTYINSSSNIETMKLLVEYGANINLDNNKEILKIYIANQQLIFLLNYINLIPK
jgi:ankyrin repeat protein